MRAGLATVLAASLLPSAAAGASLRIVSPTTGAILGGPVTLSAAVEPSGAGRRVVSLTFSVDGVPVCRLRHPPWRCRFDAGGRLTPRFVRAVARLRGGGRLVASRLTKGVDRRLAVDVNLVQVTATVTDGRGRLVRGLAPHDFHVFEDGVEQPISHFVPATAAREIVVAVDMSGSMAEAMPGVRAAVAAFLGALRGDDHVTLMAFNDEVFTLARRETDAAARGQALGRLSAWGGTALHDAILRSYDALDRVKGRKAAVIFTDGDDRSSRATAAEVEARAERSDAPVYMIGQGRGTRDPSLRRALERLARMGGGRAFYTDRPDELGGVFRTILDELQSQYVLAYASPSEEYDGAWHTIRVEAGPGRVVRARQGFRAEAGP